jgi:hypothetical protein
MDEFSLAGLGLEDHGDVLAHEIKLRSRERVFAEHYPELSQRLQKIKKTQDYVVTNELLLKYVGILDELRANPFQSRLKTIVVDLMRTILETPHRLDAKHNIINPMEKLLGKIESKPFWDIINPPEPAAPSRKWFGLFPGDSTPPTIELPPLGHINTEEIIRLETALQMLEQECSGYTPEMAHVAMTAVYPTNIVNCVHLARVKSLLDSKYAEIKNYLLPRKGGKTKKIQKRLRRTTKIQKRKKLK